MRQWLCQSGTISRRCCDRQDDESSPCPSAQVVGGQGVARRPRRPSGISEIANDGGFGPLASTEQPQEGTSFTRPCTTQTTLSAPLQLQLRCRKPGRSRSAGTTLSQSHSAAAPLSLGASSLEYCCQVRSRHAHTDRLADASLATIHQTDLLCRLPLCPARRAQEGCSPVRQAVGRGQHQLNPGRGGSLKHRRAIDPGHWSCNWR